MDTETQKEIKVIADRLTDMVLSDKVNERDSQIILTVIDSLSEMLTNQP